jgi:two-component system alkaline phosphatase synthesis response regulator PhoP
MTSEGRKILVVDDEESIRDILQRMLEGIGYEVITADDGRDALYKLSLGEARIVLLDMKMPGMTGFDMLKKLGNDISNYCIIMVTVVTDTQIAVDSLKLGAMDYITKPFDQDDLIAKLYTAIEKYNRMISDRKHYEQIQANVIKQTDRMREQFNELISSQAREHNLISRLSTRQAPIRKDIFGRRSEEKEEKNTDIEEFKDAVYRVLKKNEENTNE